MIVSWPWKVKIPHKVACFSWLVARQAVLIQDNFMKRGRQLCSRTSFKLQRYLLGYPRDNSDVLASWKKEGNRKEHLNVPH